MLYVTNPAGGMTRSTEHGVVWRIFLYPRPEIRKFTSLTRREFLTTLKVSMLFFWVVALCGLVSRYQYLGQTISIFSARVPKQWYLPISPRDVTSSIGTS